MPDRVQAESALATVLTSAPDTPQGKGYLSVALDEAETVQRRLDAASAPNQGKESLRREVAVALHGLDSGFGVAEPGQTDFGLRQALSRAIAGARASAAMRKGDTRLSQMVAALEAAQSRVNEAVDFGRAVMVTPSTEVARQGVRAMRMALDRAVQGWDRDGTRVIDWRRGEAGLKQAESVARTLSGSP